VTIGKKQRVNRVAKPKRKDLKSLIIPKLRELSRYWPEKKKARNLAKVKVQVGFFKNGNPKFETKFKCASCELLFPIEETQMDHINAVIEVDKGWVSWDVYIERLFCPADGYQCLCIGCHEIKTSLERQYRADVKKELDKNEE
jgi:hypothetical protein